jgi:hypothetical protein
VVLDGRGIVATLTAADADTTARALARAASHAHRERGQMREPKMTVRQRWNDDLEE